MKTMHIINTQQNKPTEVIHKYTKQKTHNTTQKNKETHTMYSHIEKKNHLIVHGPNHDNHENIKAKIFRIFFKLSTLMQGF